VGLSSLSYPLFESYGFEPPQPRQQLHPRAGTAPGSYPAG
jgi:hypothetical protein